MKLYRYLLTWFSVVILLILVAVFVFGQQQNITISQLSGSLASFTIVDALASTTTIPRGDSYTWHLSASSCLPGMTLGTIALGTGEPTPATLQVVQQSAPCQQPPQRTLVTPKTCDSGKFFGAVTNDGTMNCDVAANAAVKPTIANQVQYVDAANGNDANDGLSWGTAKQTGCAAVDALSPLSYVSGRIYISSTYSQRLQWCTEVPNNGMWFLGPRDRNFINFNSISRSGNVVTLTVNANGNGLLPVYVNKTNQVNGYIKISQCADPSFNGVFPVTSMPAKNQIQWSQAGPNATTTGCFGWPGGFRVIGYPGSSNLTITGGQAGYPASLGGQTFIGDAAHQSGGGSAYSTLKPAIWVSALTGLTIENIGAQYPAKFISLGIDTTYDRSGNGGVSGVVFNNIGCGLNQIDSAGPAIDIGSNTFWIRFNNSANCSNNVAEQRNVNSIVISGGLATLTASSNLPGDMVAGSHMTLLGTCYDGVQTLISVSGATATFNVSNTTPNQTCGASGQLYSDRAYGVVIDPGSGSGAGDIFWTGQPFAGGSPGPVISYGGVNGSGISLERYTLEGDYVHPTPPALVIGPGGCALSNYFVRNVDIADLPASTPIVFNTACSGSQVFVYGANNGNVNNGGTLVRGAATVATAQFGTGVNSALSQHQMGFAANDAGPAGLPRVIGRQEGHVRGLSPVAIRFPNIVSTNPADWITFTYGSVGAISVTPVLSPDGTNDAGHIVATGASNGGYVVFNYNAPISTLTIGDVYIGMAMTRSGTKNGYPSGNIPIQLNMNMRGAGGGDRCYETWNGYQFMVGDGEWDIYAVMCTVATNPQPTTMYFGVPMSANTTNTVDIFMPTLIRIPAGSTSYNEIFEIIGSMLMYGRNAPQGTVASLPGVDVAWGGAGDQFYMRHTHTLTADHTATWQNKDGTVMFGIGARCAMSSSTSCTATVPSTTTMCVAMQQSTGTVIAGGCSVSGTTATVTAASSNSSTWGIVAF